MTTRVAQTGRVCIAIVLLTLGTAGARAADDDGKAVYDNYCALCHDKGLLDAPRLGQKKDWKRRLAKSDEVLMSSVLNGLNNMPPKGGYGRKLSDDEVRAATRYLLNASR